MPGPVPTSPANRDFQGGFAVALMAKDLGLAANALEAGQVASILGRTAADVYRRLAESDRAGLDFSVVIDAVRDGSITSGASA